jgi:hypothetical protein
MAIVSNLIAITQCDAAVDAIDVGGAGTLKFYSGSAPADLSVAATGSLLATLAFTATAFDAAADDSAGGAECSISSAISATAITLTGDAQYARAVSGGSVEVIQFTVGGTGSGMDIIIDVTDAAPGAPLVGGADLSLSTFTYTQNEV